MTPRQCRMARSALDLTVRGLAEKVGIAPSTVTLFENGKKVRWESMDTMEQWFISTGQIQFLGQDGVFFTSIETISEKERKRAGVMSDYQPIAEDELMKTAQALLASRITHLRETLELTKVELSLRADIDASYIHQLERGTANPTLLVLLKVAAALGTNVGNLLIQEEKTPD